MFQYFIDLPLVDPHYSILQIKIAGIQWTFHKKRHFNHQDAAVHEYIGLPMDKIFSNVASHKQKTNTDTYKKQEHRQT